MALWCAWDSNREHTMQCLKGWGGGGGGGGGESRFIGGGGAGLTS